MIKTNSTLKLALGLLVCSALLAPTAQAMATTAGEQAVANQQNQVTISGIVKDDLNEPLFGAYVVEKGTSNGVSTDFDGKFQIKVPAGTTLVFTYIGMQPQELVVSKSGEYTITLQQDNKLLDEVVVTGYQTLSKERSTGAFAKIDTKTFELKRMDNLGSMLEGQVAGYVDGKIRGVTTMNAVSNPMVVIDGFPVENTSMNRIGETTEAMPDLNPEDIESITVLKDAAAASIYGARAANGVIVITTKKAKQGKTDVSFSATLTTQKYDYYTGNRTNAADVVSLQKYWASQNADLLAGGASAQKVAGELREEGAYPTAGVDALLDFYTGKISQNELDAKLNQLSSMGMHYYDQAEKYAKRNPFTQQYNLRVGKTTETNSFNFSAAYWDQKFEDINSDSKKLGINLNNTVKIAKWLQADMGVYLKMGNDNTQSYDVYAPGFSVAPYDAMVAILQRYHSLTKTNVILSHSMA